MLTRRQLLRSAASVAVVASFPAANSAPVEAFPTGLEGLNHLEGEPVHVVDPAGYFSPQVSAYMQPGDLIYIGHQPARVVRVEADGSAFWRAA